MADASGSDVSPGAPTPAGERLTWAGVSREASAFTMDYLFKRLLGVAFAAGAVGVAFLVGELKGLPATSAWSVWTAALGFGAGVVVIYCIGLWRGAVVIAARIAEERDRERAGRLAAEERTRAVEETLRRKPPDRAKVEIEWSKLIQVARDRIARLSETDNWERDFAARRAAFIVYRGKVLEFMQASVVDEGWFAEMSALPLTDHFDRSQPYLLQNHIMQLGGWLRRMKTHVGKDFKHRLEPDFDPAGWSERLN